MADKVTDGSGRSTVVLTFFIADVRGYTRFTRERGDAAAAILAKRFADLARDVVEARGGRVIELRGDEALAVFESEAQAVRAAVEFQATCAEESDAHPAFPLPVGIGIDSGEAVPVEDGYRGVALNLAARLCSNAAAGEILVTRTVAERIAGTEGEIALVERGPATFKGFEHAVDVVEAVAEEAHERRALPEKAAELGRGIPPELDPLTPLVDREPEMRWIRGTWRQARRGSGRLLFVSGPAQIGKTRLAGEAAAHVHSGGGLIRYAGAGGTATAMALSAIRETLAASVPTLLVLDGVDVAGPPVARELLSSLEELSGRPVLLLALLRDPAASAELSAVIEQADQRGDGHRVLRPFDLDGVRGIVHLYAGEDTADVPLESMARASRGVPGRVHEVASDWARSEASRRLAAAAEFLSAGRDRHASDLEFANNVIGLKLGRLYSVEGRDVLASDTCPYKGLAQFEEQDSAYFFGRERLVGELAARTVQAGLLGVVGASGSGKSSVVSAGLLPSLAAGLLPGSDRWRQAVLRPGEHPVEELRAVLQRSLGSDVTTLEAASNAIGSEGSLVLVVDQFEEVFSICPDEEERTSFIGELADAATRWPERVVIVVVIRDDFYGRCAPYVEFAELLAANHVLVAPMTVEELRRAMELPARRAGLRVESALVDALVEEVAEEPGSLPLLSTTLVELWQGRSEGWIRLEAHERMGGVRGAVARLAEESFYRLEGPQREAARLVLLRLAGEGEGDAVTRRRVPISEFDVDRDTAAAEVIARFTEDRLLTTSDSTVEVAHEALLREWPRLRDWLAEDVQGRQLKAHLTEASKQWHSSGREPGELYRGARLSATLDWATLHGRELNELEREFLGEAREASEREAARQRRTNRRLRGLLIGTALFLVVALLAGSIALIQRRHARTAQSAAEAQALRSDAERIGTLALTEPNLDRSMLFAVAGVELQDLLETRSDLLSVLQKSPALVRLFHVPGGGAAALAISPDGSLLASADSAGTVHVNDFRTGKPKDPAVRLGEPISQQAMVFSPNGRTMAVGTAASGRANLYVIDMSSRIQKRIGSWPSIPPSAGPLRFIRMAFSPDGSRIAVAVATAATARGQPALPFPVSERLLLLRAATGRVVWARDYPLGDAVNEATVGFTPQGKLVTSAQHGETLLWNTTTGRIERRYPVGGPFALSPNGHFAALALNSPNPADQSSSLAVLDLRTGHVRSLGPLPAKAWIISLQFTPDGKNIVGVSTEGGLRAWDVASGSIVQTYATNGLGMAMSPDGQTVVTQAGSDSISAWDLGGTHRLGRVFRWNDPTHGCPVAPCFVINRQSTQMADDQGDGTVALIDLRSHRLIDTLHHSNGQQADALAFTPDGRTLVTGGVNSSVKLWDVRTASVPRTLQFSEPVWWVAVSPDGGLLAAQTQKQGSPISHVEVRDLGSGAVLYRHEVPNGKGGVEFSGDGRALAALGCCQPESTIEVWVARSGAELFHPRVEGHATAIAFSPDGRLLGAGTEDGKVVLWDARTGRQLGPPLQVAGGSVSSVSFSPDGRQYAVSAGDQTATVWDIGSRKRIGDTFPIVQAVIPAAYFAPNGDLVIDYEAQAAQWPMDARSWERFACKVAGRDLTRREWSDELPGRPYRHVCPK